MRSAGRVLELSLAANGPWANPEISAKRTSSLQRLSSPTERTIALGLDYLARQHTSLAKVALQGISRASAGMTYLGNGAMASVYRSGDEVTKVYRQTALMTPEGRGEYRDRQDTLSKTLSLCLGSLVTDQTFEIGTHPLGDYEVVLGKQPFVRGRNLNLFVTNTTDLHEDAIASYCQRRHSGQAQLEKLIDATFDASDSSGIVPDLNGTDNFRLQGDAEVLSLIDAQPISQHEHPGVHDLILSQAESLARFLDAA